mgnify:CR=1 FL=1
MEKARVTAVSYLNTIPYVWGLRHYAGSRPWDLSLDVPAMCAKKLIHGQADVGLIPAGAMRQLPSNFTDLDWGIAADGEVASVLLLSRLPLKEIRKVVLDIDSRTSVLLIRILARNHWNISPEWEDGSVEEQLPESGLFIGDKAFRAQGHYPFVYDLSQEWKQMTALPFVFAAWTASTLVPGHIREHFGLALECGTQNITSAIEEYGHDHPGVPDPEDYLRRRIRYRLGKSERAGLDLFRRMTASLI